MGDQTITPPAGYSLVDPTPSAITPPPGYSLVNSAPAVPTAPLTEQDAANSNFAAQQSRKTPPMQPSTVGELISTLQTGPGGQQTNPRADVVQDFSNRWQQGLDEAAQGKITSPGLATGALKGVAETAHTVGRLTNKATGDNISSLPTTFKQPESLLANNTSESIGKAAENVLEFISGDEAVKSMSLGARFTQLARLTETLSKHPVLAKLAAIGANSLRTGGVGTIQSLFHNTDVQQATESGAIAGVTGGALESLGVGLGSLKKYLFPQNVLRYIDPDGVVAEIAANEAHQIPAGSRLIQPGSTQTAEATATGGLSSQQAGEEIQQDARAIRQSKGAEVGKAKEAVEASIPETSTGEKVSLTLSPESRATITGRTVLDDIGNQKIDLKDPDMDDVRSIAEQFVTGKDADGKVLSFNPEEIDSTNRALNSKIKSLEGQVKNGANGQALGYLKQLKAALQDDIFDFYAKVGDADAAENLRKLNAEYASLVNDQTKGAAKSLLKTQKPEQIVNSIISGGSNAQSATETLLRNLSPDGQKLLRQSVTRELYGKNSLPNGEIDMQAVQQQFNRMGETAKSLYGKQYADLKAFIDSAADFQKTKNAGSLFGRVKNRVVGGALHASATAAGAHAAGPAGAVVGHAAGQELADIAVNGSGAVKIGIRPDEVITLAPEQIADSRIGSALAKFAEAAKNQDFKSAVSAYAAIQSRLEIPKQATHLYEDGEIKPLE